MELILTETSINALICYPNTMFLFRQFTVTE